MFDATARITFSVLGPLRAWRDGIELDIGSPQQCSVLAALLLSEGAFLTPERLVDGIWGDRAPRAARATIRTYIYRLRRLFESDGGNRIKLLGGGYALTVGDDEVDLAVFTSLLSQARTARARGDHPSALELLDRGLALWRGTPLAGVPGPYAEAQRTSLQELRLAAVGERLAIAVDLGRHVEVASELPKLIAEHPLVESLRELQMIALYGSGRRAEALAVFADTRRLLREELGVDPAPRLREIHRRILAAEPDAVPGARPGSVPAAAPGSVPGSVPAARPGSVPGSVSAAPPGSVSGARPGSVPGSVSGARPGSVPGSVPAAPPGSVPAAVPVVEQEAAPVAGPAGASEAERLPGPERLAEGEQAPDPAQPVPPPVVARPAQLPADLPDFVGRADELHLLAELAGESGPRRASAIVIGGMAGIGKTTLAVHAAHRLAANFPDGQLYVNLRGFDPDGGALDPAVALAAFLQALGVPARELPAGRDERAALFRSLLVDRRVLILLDNARDAAQVRPLLPGTATCLAVITSRNQLPGLTATHGAHPMRLSLFDTGQAREFLCRRLGATAAAESPRALDEIIERCGRLPLALAVVAARAAYEEDFPLGVIAEHLGTAPGSLDALAGEDPTTNARVVFSWSYRAMDPDAARLFRLLALHPGPDVTVPAAASLFARPVPETRQTLARLARAHLLSADAPDRYSCHDLLRAYADELGREHDGPRDREQALHRLLDHYLHTAAAASRLHTANRLPIELSEPRPGVSVPELDTAQQATAWFTARYRVLVELVTRAEAGGRFDAHVWQLTWAVTQFLHGRGLWQEMVGLNRTALAAASRLGDPFAQAHIHSGLGRALGNLGRLEEAGGHMRRALDLFDGTADAITRAETHRVFSWVLEQQGRYDLALDHAEQALRLHRDTGDRARRATALNAVGWCHALLGQYDRALSHCRQALRLLEEMGEVYGQADTWDSLGFVHHHLGQYREAIHAYRLAARFFHESGIRYAEANTLSRLGDTQRETGDTDAAGESWGLALAILVELNHPDAAKVRDKLGGPDRPRTGRRPPATSHAG